MVYIVKKLLFSIKDKSLLISFNYNLEKENLSLINTNIISDNKLIFSDDYIEKNEFIVGKFLKEIITDNNINQIIITNFEIIKILSETLEMIDIIDSLFISDEGNFPYEIYEILVKNKNLII